ncbi:hypothetical protein BC828DRAFT_385633 [Blastocladiella britannica]|nr:hypothetical protein BC828DRAFT_385633 [Blastocladiella britannica]
MMRHSSKQRPFGTNPYHMPTQPTVTGSAPDPSSPPVPTLANQLANAAKPGGSSSTLASTAYSSTAAATRGNSNGSSNAFGFHHVQPPPHRAGGGSAAPTAGTRGTAPSTIHQPPPPARAPVPATPATTLSLPADRSQWTLADLVAWGVSQHSGAMTVSDFFDMIIEHETANLCAPLVESEVLDELMNQAELNGLFDLALQQDELLSLVDGLKQVAAMKAEEGDSAADRIGLEVDDAFGDAQFLAQDGAPPPWLGVDVLDTPGRRGVRTLLTPFTDRMRRQGQHQQQIASPVPFGGRRGTDSSSALLATAASSRAPFGRPPPPGRIQRLRSESSTATQLSADTAPKPATTAGPDSWTIPASASAASQPAMSMRERMALTAQQQQQQQQHQNGATTGDGTNVTDEFLKNFTTADGAMGGTAAAATSRIRPPSATTGLLSSHQPSGVTRTSSPPVPALAKPQQQRYFDVYDQGAPARAPAPLASSRYGGVQDAWPEASYPANGTGTGAMTSNHRAPFHGAGMLAHAPSAAEGVDWHAALVEREDEIERQAAINQRLRSELDQYKKELADAGKHEEVILGKVDEFQEHAQHLKRKIQDLKAQHTRLQQRHADADARATQLEHDLETARRELDERQALWDQERNEWQEQVLSIAHERDQYAELAQQQQQQVGGPDQEQQWGAAPADADDAADRARATAASNLGTELAGALGDHHQAGNGTAAAAATATGGIDTQLHLERMYSENAQMRDYVDQLQAALDKAAQRAPVHDSVAQTAPLPATAEAEVQVRPNRLSVGVQCTSLTAASSRRSSAQQQQQQQPNTPATAYRASMQAASRVPLRPEDMVEPATMVSGLGATFFGADLEDDAESGWMDDESVMAERVTRHQLQHHQQHPGELTGLLDDPSFVAPDPGSPTRTGPRPPTRFSASTASGAGAAAPSSRPSQSPPKSDSHAPPLMAAAGPDRAPTLRQRLVTALVGGSSSAAGGSRYASVRWAALVLASLLVVALAWVWAVEVTVVGTPTTAYDDAGSLFSPSQMDTAQVSGISSLDGGGSGGEALGQYCVWAASGDVRLDPLPL